MLEAVEEAQRLIDSAATQAAYDECAADAGYFIDQHVIIDEPQGDGVATLPFKLWPAQVGVLDTLIAQKLVIILKARQLGISWLCCAYVLWHCLFKPGRVWLFLSKGEVEAHELARRVKVMYQRLPLWLQERVPLTQTATEALGWGNGSRVQSLAATKNAGRSFTASGVLMDEFAFMQWGEDVYTAVKPTVDNGGQLFVVSTANGEGDGFHKRYTDADKGLNNFAPIFLSWRDRPSRDDAWRAAVAAEALDARKDLQEYPSTPLEAFQSSGGDRYLPSITLWDACKADVPALDAKTPIVLALDAGVTNDCFAAVAVSRHWLNHDDVAVRYVRVWIPSGGKALDFDAIERELLDTVISKYNVVQVGFDIYQMVQMSQGLGTKVWVRPFSQQQERLKADAALLQLILRRRIVHDGNAVLRAHLDNSDRKNGEEADTLRIVKRDTSKKVDAAVALSMAASEILRLAV